MCKIIKQVCEHNNIPNFKSIKRVLKNSKQKIRWLTPDEYMKIIYVINGKLKTNNSFYTRQRKRIIKLAVFSGLRKEEYLSLIPKDHINFQNNTRHVKDTKNGSDRILPMTKIIREVLQEQLQDIIASGIESN